MVKRARSRPNGGRGKKECYDTTVMRVPLPLKQQVTELIDQFYKDIALPLEGDWNDILGVSPSTSADEVRKAYLRLAKLYHPDRARVSDAHERIQAINKAYEEFQIFYEKSDNSL